MKIRLTVASAALIATCLVGCSKKPEGEKADVPAKPAGPEIAAAPAAPRTATNQWTTTASGLKYQVLKKGTGTKSPTASSTVKVHYHGTLLNGKVFDSSVDRGEPISFPLNQVIAGWTEGVQLMKVGDKFKFEIPPNLAYGPAGAGDVIPPNSTLIFEVELLEIQ